MKVVYLGSDVFLPCFEYFLKNHEVLALYTYHNNEDYFSEYEIKSVAEQNNISVYYDPISSEEITRLFKEEGCELLFSAEYNRILPIPDDLSEFRGINIHNSLLPTGRSYYPIEAGMEREISCTGVTFHILEATVDSGAILSQRQIPITPAMDSIDIYLSCAEHAVKMLEEIMSDFDAFWSGAKKQSVKPACWKRPDERKLTLCHETSCSEAIDIFRRYNSLTQVFINGKWYYVTGMTASEHRIKNDRFVSPILVLYPVQDGHLRLQLRPKDAAEESND